MSDNSNELGAFLAGFVIGGLVGAATAIILAPQSGAETRTQIANRSNQFMHTGGEQLQELMHRANEQLATPLHQLDEARGRVQEQARIVLDKGRERVAKNRDTAPETEPQEDAPPTENDKA